ncbi:hypothetical protein I5907_13135 [Panacibacter sp. DH6]|uniref:Outer membrane protein beta-barrel domain-containing protein n=1 Tax=Panacibacter microcysteis TaxID=2793269 RepID=A0A931E881_9BACT|nr:hypothetical protein [Panacibacter microcysteis]MBG9377181.1 hypothetical protein [Panacibacter microcysteis]
MKKIILFSIFIAASYSVYAQVGLLSSNNKNYIRSQLLSDTTYKFPALTFADNNLWYFDNPYESTIISGEDDYYFENMEQKRKMDSLLRNNDQKDSLLAIYVDSLRRIRLVKRQTDSALSVIIKNNNQALRNVFNDKFSSLKNQNMELQKAILKSNFLTRHYPIDSLQVITDFSRFTTDMSEIYADLEQLKDLNNKRLNEIESGVERMNAINNLDTINFEKDNLPELQLTLSKAWGKIAKDTEAITTKFKNDTTNYNNISKTYDNKLKSYITPKLKSELQKTSDFGAFPQLTSVLGKREVIPQLQLYGSYNYENKTTSVEANIGLSFAASSNADSGNIHDIFIPTASKFLIYTNFNYSFWSTNQSTSNDKDSAKRLAIKLGFSFAGKNLVFDTTKKVNSINSTMLYAKGGLELGVLPKRFSIYANVNTVSLLDKIDDFKTATGINSKFFGYLDCGARFFLDPAPQAKVDLGLYIYSDINFIINGGDVKRVTHSNDLVIPSIQLGIVKRLGRL